MIRKLFTLPDQLAEQLNREKNQSATVAEALTLYYKHKETVRQLAENTGKIVEILQQSTQKSSKPVYQGISQQIEDKELEKYVQAYTEDGFKFQRRPDGIYANRPPLKEWVKAEVINY